MTSTPAIMKATDYRTQAEAEREARAAIWGDVPFARRAFVLGDRIGPVCLNVVSATVNGRTVAFTFDQYGRRDRPPVVA